MATKVDHELCDGCSDCKDVCPTDAINIESSKAEVNPDICIDCNACVDACTKNAMQQG